jgi:type IVB pilus formation R64 PilN family outer membrane protein
MTLKIKHSTFALALALVAALVSGCASPSLTQQVKSRTDSALQLADLASQPTISGTANADTPGTSAHAERAAAAQRNMPTLRRSRATWIGTRMVPVTQEDQLPEVFREQRVLNFSDSGRLSLAAVAARLTKITNVPVRIANDVTASSAIQGRPISAITNSTPAAGVMPGAGIPPAAFMPADGQPRPNTTQTQPGGNGAGQPAVRHDREAISAVQPIALDNVEMQWQGSLLGYLNHLTDRLGLAWEYRDNTVVIMRFVSEVHQVDMLPGGQNYNLGSVGSTSGNSGGAGSQVGGSSNIDIQEKGALDAVASIEKAVSDMIASVPGSTITRAEGSGNLLVKTSREMQGQVRDFISKENTAMRKQSLIQFDIFTVRTNNTDELGFNWDILYQSLAKTYGVSLASPTTLTSSTAGGITFNLLTANGTADWQKRFPTAQSIVNTLAQMGDSVQHRPVNMFALNRMWRRTNQLKQTGYLAETVPGPATQTGVGAPGLKPGTVTTGDTYAVMAQVLQDNSVMLRFALSMSDLIGLFDATSGTGSTLQKIQTPDVQAINEFGTVLLKPGQVMVISGMSKLVTTSDKRSLTEDLPIWTGGSRKRSMQREHVLIFVRPVLL